MLQYFLTLLITHYFKMQVQASQIFWIGLGMEFFEYLDPK